MKEDLERILRVARKRKLSNKEISMVQEMAGLTAKIYGAIRSFEKRRIS